MADTAQINVPPLSELDGFEVFLTTNQLASRWGMCPQSLANARSQDRGLPYMKLTGQIRYRSIDVIREETTGTHSPTATAVRAAVAEVPNLPDDMAEIISNRIIAKLVEKPDLA